MRSRANRREILKALSAFGFSAMMEPAEAWKHGAPEVQSGLPVWFSASPITSGSQNDDDVFPNMIAAGAAFQTMMDSIAVYKMIEVQAALLSNTVLTNFFTYLNNKGVKLGVEALALVATQGQPGYGTDGFSEHADDLLDLLTIIKNNGRKVAYVAWDEPYLHGVTTGYLTLSQTAAQVAHSATVVKGLFPDCLIGDIEFIGDDNTTASKFQTWLTAYENAAGSQFAFFQEDIGAWMNNSGGWQTPLAAVTAMLRSNNVQVQAIVNGWYDAATKLQWVQQGEALAATLWNTPALKPDVMLVQSWYPLPSEVPDPTDDNTLAYLANQVVALV